ncbi:molybdopterin guanine dinucleotide-containing S/N-oxide reductase [Hoeflea sp. TYP-13]|uniref:molybdopterin guanine dinucleotide-containing S/N-oxide reductase n=1 Tax=Hoeflea sp. TYP-13 TaxID=3230023 RepID=UPI0034C628D9
MTSMPLTSAHWGTYRVEVRDGMIVALHPFEENPNPSPIGEGIVEALTDANRIRQPMIRRSWLEHGPGANSEQRGSDPYVAVSWDDAEVLVADELNRVRKKYGNSAIYGGSYGWASAGRFHHAQSQVHRFLNCIGGYTRSVNTYSFAAAEVAVPHILGDFRKYVNSVTSWSSVIANTDLFVAFGGVPIKNGQIDNGGVGRHVQLESIVDAARAGVTFINIDPDRAAIPKEVDAKWLAPRPCTDAAIMLGLAHVLLTEDLADGAFLNDYTVGYEKVCEYLTGRIDGVVKSPEWAAKISELPAETIRTLARRMAKERTMISVSWSLTRQQYGEQPYWAAITLAAMLGQIGLPGGGIGFGYSATNGIGAQYQRLPYASLPQGKNAVHDFIPVARVSDMLLNPNARFEYDGKSYTYPDVRLVYWAGGNPFHHHQDLNRLQRAWQRPETIITHEWCWTATASRADIVLPCTTPLERTDLALSPRDPYVVSMEQAIEPEGEARDDYTIFAGIADRMGCELAFTEGRTAEEWQRWIYESSRQRFAEVGLELPPLDSLRQNGWFKIDMPDRPTVMLEDFRHDPAAAPLATPSGRIELFSEKVASFGYPDCPGCAVWREPQEWLGRNNIAYPLHLICVQPHNKLHSQLDHGTISQASKINGCEPVVVSPGDAEARSISNGDKVRLHNDRGACVATAVVDDRLRPGVVQMSTGAWFRPDQDGQCINGNPNVLTPDVGTSNLGQGPSAHSCLVELKRIE